MNSHINLTEILILWSWNVRSMNLGTLDDVKRDDRDTRTDYPDEIPT